MAAVALAHVAAWRLVARKRLTVWTAMAPLFATAGLLAVATGAVRWSGDPPAATSILLGASAGVVLWGATRAFVAIAARWPPFARHTADVYDQRRGLSLGAALAVGALLVAPGEELFWRGMFQTEVAARTSPLAGAALGWGAYVLANAASASLPIVAGAVVGGGVWAGLAWATAGIAAPLACHVAWTALMIAAPPKEAKLS